MRTKYQRKVAREAAWIAENRAPISINCIEPSINEMKMCSRVIKTDADKPECYCSAYINPDSKWRLGDCNLADAFLKSTFVPEKKRVRVGQQKTKRRNR